ncbi:MAG: response regulator [Pirellulaceae bacterium]
MAAIRVLLIEDDPAYVRLIERMLDLSPVGFDVTVADRLTMAMSELYKGRFNLIMTDLNLPDIKGLDTLDALRSAESSLPVIVLTGMEDQELEKQAISKGAQLCLRKSEINTKTLLDAMHQAVRLSRPSVPQSNVPPSKDRRVNRLLAELEENLVAVKNAIETLEAKQNDPQQQEAVHTIRSHVNKMQEKIVDHRRLEP